MSFPKEVECLKCKGKGFLEIHTLLTLPPLILTCPECKGKRKVSKVVISKDIDDDPFGVNDPISPQSQEDSEYYANEYHKAN